MQEKLSIFDDGSGTTVYEGSQAITRLAELGIELDWLHNALEAGEQSASQATKQFPVIAAGQLRWIHTVARLRTQLSEEGWNCDDPKNSPRAINADRTIAIVVSSGNRHVGNPDVDPSASRPRGAMTAYQVEVNNNLQGLDETALFDLSEDSHQTWFLLYYRSRDKQKVYAELSLPTEPGEDVTFGKFRERIIIPPVSFDYADKPLDAGLEDVDVSFIIKPRVA